MLNLVPMRGEFPPDDIHSSPLLVITNQPERVIRALTFTQTSTMAPLA